MTHLAASEMVTFRSAKALVGRYKEPRRRSGGVREAGRSSGTAGDANFGHCTMPRRRSLGGIIGLAV